MERIDIIKAAVDKGFKYDPNTGYIFGITGKVIKNKSSFGYINPCIIIDSKRYRFFTHHFAWFVSHGCLPNDGLVIDHINRNKTDNRIDNLRVVTRQENHFNTDALGYYFNKKKMKWVAQIKFGKSTHYLGQYDNDGDARQAYLDAKKIYHVIK